MNDKLQQFARQSLNDDLAKCTEAEQLVFRRIYCPSDLAKPLSEVVESIPAEKLSWAMEQVDRTNSKRQPATQPA